MSVMSKLTSMLKAKSAVRKPTVVPRPPIVPRSSQNNSYVTQGSYPQHRVDSDTTIDLTPVIITSILMSSQEAAPEPSQVYYVEPSPAPSPYESSSYSSSSYESSSSYDSGSSSSSSSSWD